MHLKHIFGEGWGDVGAVQKGGAVCEKKEKLRLAMDRGKGGPKNHDLYECPRFNLKR